MADSIILKSAEETFAYGEKLAAGCRGGEVFALHGTLGAGKTQIVKGLAKGLGYNSEVTSPTFTIIHEYEGGRLPVYHVDLYRLEDVQAVDKLGMEEYIFSAGVTAIEWPERAAHLLPANTRHIYVKITEQETRQVEEKTQS